LIRPIFRCLQTNANRPRNMGAVRAHSAKLPSSQGDDARSIRTVARKRDNLSLRYGKGASTEPLSLQGHGVTKHVWRFGARLGADLRGVSGHTPGPTRRNALNSIPSLRRGNCPCHRGPTVREARMKYRTWLPVEGGRLRCVPATFSFYSLLASEEHSCRVATP
jgi:hypothetical protein